MTLLALDTGGDYAVLALADEAGALRAARVFEGRRTLSRRLMGELDGLLRGEGLTLPDVSALAVGLGPGSFTGVRVGVTTARTLAQVTGKPLVGVPTFDAYTRGWGDTARRLVCVLPSRRGEVYVSVARAGDPPQAPFALSFDALERHMEIWRQEGDVACCGAVDLLPRRPVLSVFQRHVPPDGLVRAAADRLRDGQRDDPLSLVPLYVVAPAISTPKERRL